MKLGTKETREMICFIISLGNALGVSLKDGQLTIGDLSNFVDPLMKSGEAFAGAESIPAELYDMDEEERNELLRTAKEAFDIPQDCCEEIVEAAFDVLAEIHAMVQKIIKHCPKK